MYIKIQNTMILSTQNTYVHIQALHKQAKCLNKVYTKGLISWEILLWTSSLSTYLFILDYKLSESHLRCVEFYIKNVWHTNLYGVFNHLEIYYSPYHKIMQGTQHNRH